MAVTITCTVKNAFLKGDTAVIIIEFKQGTTVWEKEYRYSVTEPIKLAAFKDRITSDLRRDLDMKNQLNEINTYIGRSFTVTI